MGHITNYGLDISHYLDGFNNHQSGFSIKFNSFDGLAEVSGAQRCVNDIEKRLEKDGSIVDPGTMGTKTTSAVTLLWVSPL